jgi:hypothetical protein
MDPTGALRTDLSAERNIGTLLPDDVVYAALQYIQTLLRMRKKVIFQKGWLQAWARGMWGMG